MRISQMKWEHVSQKVNIRPNRGENPKQIGNSINNSRNIHMYSQHPQVHSCKNPDQFEFNKHGN